MAPSMNAEMRVLLEPELRAFADLLIKYLSFSFFLPLIQLSVDECGGFSASCKTVSCISVVQCLRAPNFGGQD